MSSKLPVLDTLSQQNVLATITRQRLGKYLRAAGQDVQKALRLYVLNTKVSASVFVDLHYIEVALRNQFDRELAAKYGPEWFKDAGFLSLLNGRGQDILKKAQRDAKKNWVHGPVPPGKVIAELTFGFWLQLTDSRLEHTLWVPCLHKAFLPRKAPKRSTFNQQLEKLRQLRNRVAHHEPIFQMDLNDAQRIMGDVCNILCPSTARLMQGTSTVRRDVMGLAKYCKQKGL